MFVASCDISVKNYFIFVISWFTHPEMLVFKHAKWHCEMKTTSGLFCT